MVRGLHIRLTQTVDKRLGLYKHRRGVIREWTWHADEDSVEVNGER